MHRHVWPAELYGYGYFASRGGKVEPESLEYEKQGTDAVDAAGPPRPLAERVPDHKESTALIKAPVEGKDCAEVFGL